MKHSMSMDKTKDGDRLVKLLKSRDLNQSELARMTGKTATSVTRWIKQLNEGNIPEDSWSEIVQALARKGIDATTIRPARRPTAVRTELVPLLERFPGGPEQLDALRQILDADDEAREILRVLVLDRLQRTR